LCAKEEDLTRSRESLEPSNFMSVLEQAVYDSGRWQKWLQPEEYPDGRVKEGWASDSSVDTLDVWNGLTSDRRSWLTQTGARYIWTAAPVLAARETLYRNLSRLIPDPHQVVVDRIAQSMEKYVVAFHLFDSLTHLEGD